MRSAHVAYARVRPAACVFYETLNKSFTHAVDHIRAHIAICVLSYNSVFETFHKIKNGSALADPFW